MVINIVSFIFFLIRFFGDTRGNIERLKKIPVQIWLLFSAMILSMILSSVFSINPAGGLIETGRQLLFILLFLFIISFLKTGVSVWIIPAALVFTGLFTAVPIIYQFLTTPNSVYYLQTHGFIQTGGIFANVAAAGGVFAVCIPATLALLLNKKTNYHLSSFFLIPILLIQTSALLLTNSRAAIIGAVVGVVIILLFANPRRTLAITGIIAILIGGIIVTDPLNIFSLYFRSERILENTRYYLWDIAWQTIKDNPIIGTGPGQFKYYIYQYLPVMLGSWDEKQLLWVFENSGLGHQHNFLLFRWSELGLLGLFTGAWFIYLYFYYSVSSFRFRSRQVRQENRYLYYMLIAIGAGMVVRSIFEATGIMSHGWIGRDLPFWLVFGCAIKLHLDSRTDIGTTIESAEENTR
jgi:O-antigen ligase